MSVSDSMVNDPIGDGMLLPKGYLASEEKTFQYEDTFPSLPVPKLEQTLAKYLESVRPLVTKNEFERTEQIVQSFCDNEGLDLHNRLQQKAIIERNWVEHWWEEYAYLRNREPHIPFVNFAGPGPYINTFWPPREGSQIERGAITMWFALKYWQILRKEQLRVDRGGRTTLWCMQQVHRMFNDCKTPGREVDTLNHYFNTEAEGVCASHMVIISNGRFYKIQVLHADGSLISVPELQMQCAKIREDSVNQTPGAGLGYLTTENRTTWAKLREHLVELHPDNKDHLMAIQDSIIVMVLDDRSPGTDNELTMEGLCGNPANRWFDKTLQLIIFRNGTISCNGDHSPYDAVVPVFMMYFIQESLELNNMTWQGRQDIRDMLEPEELVFHLDPVIVQGISEAKKHYEITGSSIELHIDHYRRYGKSFIRKYKYHPDTFIQMAIQLAYYRIYNRFHCTMEVVDWVKAMLNPSIQLKQRLVLLTTAMDKHLKLMQEAMENEGCDRHLFGLQLMAHEDGLPVPEIFKDPSWKKSGGSGNFMLSTSFIGFTPCFGGVAPMCKDGFGIFYSIVSDSINVFVSSWKADDTSSREMFENISQSLDDMDTLIQSNTAKL